MALCCINFSYVYKYTRTWGMAFCYMSQERPFGHTWRKKSMMDGDGRRTTTDDGRRRTTDNGRRRTTDDGRRTTDDGRRRTTTDARQRTTADDDARRWTTDDGRTDGRRGRRTKDDNGRQKKRRPSSVVVPFCPSLSVRSLSSVARRCLSSFVVVRPRLSNLIFFIRESCNTLHNTTQPVGRQSTSTDLT